MTVPYLLGTLSRTAANLAAEQESFWGPSKMLARPGTPPTYMSKIEPIVGRTWILKDNCDYTADNVVDAQHLSWWYTNAADSVTGVPVRNCTNYQGASYKYDAIGALQTIVLWTVLRRSRKVLFLVFGPDGVPSYFERCGVARPQYIFGFNAHELKDDVPLHRLRLIRDAMPHGLVNHFGVRTLVTA